MRPLAYYGFFIVLSAVIHYAVIRPPWGPLGRRAAAPPPPAEAGIEAEIIKTAEELEKVAKAIEETAKQMPPPPPPPAPAPEPKVEEPKPPPPPTYVDNAKDEERKLEIARLEEEKEKAAREKEEQAKKAEEAKRLAEAERQKREQEKRVADAERQKLEQEKRDLERRLAEAQRAADVQAQKRIEAETARHAEAERAENERRRRATAEAEAKRRADEAARALADTRAREEAARQAAREREAELARRIAQNEDYERLRTERWSVTGVKVPALKFDEQGRSFRERADLMKYYHMELVVYTKSSDFVARVDPLTGRYAEIARADRKAFQEQFAQRMIALTGTIYDDYAAEIARATDRKAETLIFGALLPARTDDYIARKQVEACQRAGVKPDEVQLTIAAYEQDRQTGHWNLKIRKLRLFRGNELDVAEGARMASPAATRGG